MTNHELVAEVSDGSLVVRGCVRVVCNCGWEGVWMPPELPDADGQLRPTVEYAPVLMDTLRPFHPEDPPLSMEEALYQKLLARLVEDGHVT